MSSVVLPCQLLEGGVGSLHW